MTWSRAECSGCRARGLPVCSGAVQGRRRWRCWGEGSLNVLPFDDCLELGGVPRDVAQGGIGWGDAGVEDLEGAKYPCGRCDPFAGDHLAAMGLGAHRAPVSLVGELVIGPRVADAKGEGKAVPGTRDGGADARNLDVVGLCGFEARDLRAGRGAPGKVGVLVVDPVDPLGHGVACRCAVLPGLVGLIRGGDGGGGTARPLPLDGACGKHEACGGKQAERGADEHGGVLSGNELGGRSIGVAATREHRSGKWGRRRGQNCAGAEFAGLVQLAG